MARSAENLPVKPKAKVKAKPKKAAKAKKPRQIPKSAIGMPTLAEVRAEKAKARKSRAKGGKPGAPLGNQFWLLRSKHGRDKIFQTPEDLRDACHEYFIAVDANPIMEMKVASIYGKWIRTEVPKMRAMTVEGLCIFLGCTKQTWDNYRARKDYFGVIEQVEAIIYQQKLTGAAADMLNANIISRHLGLKDTVRSEQTGANGGPIQSIVRTVVDPVHAK
jgi:hypothetical protein